LISDITAGDGKTANSFLQCRYKVREDARRMPGGCMDVYNEAKYTKDRGPLRRRRKQRSRLLDTGNSWTQKQRDTP
jgi:hypothetical protein